MSLLNFSINLDLKVPRSDKNIFSCRSTTNWETPIHSTYIEELWSTLNYGHADISMDQPSSRLQDWVDSCLIQLVAEFWRWCNPHIRICSLDIATPIMVSADTYQHINPLRGNDPGDWVFEFPGVIPCKALAPSATILRSTLYQILAGLLTSPDDVLICILPMRF